MAGVYVLVDPVTGFTKVGRASDLQTRLANLRTANPRLQLARWYETGDAALVEAYVHAEGAHSSFPRWEIADAIFLWHQQCRSLGPCAVFA